MSHSASSPTASNPSELVVFDLDVEAKQIAQQLKLSASSVAKAIQLFEEGNTLPFIARYRKEATGNLDEMQLRQIEDALAKAKELCDRKKTILKSMEGQGVLTTQLQQKILDCTDKKTLEDIYLPFKPKRRTKATIAREQGLQPLADLLLKQDTLPEAKSALLARYVDAKKGVESPEAALKGACDIVAEVWSEDVETRSWLKERAAFGQVVSKVKRGKKEEDSKFQQYFEHGESVRRIPSHRLLAMLRGQAEGVLNVSVQLEDDEILPRLERRLISNPNFAFRDQLKDTVTDCYQRLLVPATESAVLEELKEAADTDAISVFASNLRQLLMSPPAGPVPTIGIDPGFRTGCKVAVVDGTGKFLTHTTIYPTPPKSDQAAAAATLLKLIKQHSIGLIAIGNGTASRETDAFVSQLIKDNQLSVTKVVVNESGASIYSASDVAIAEYPDLDLTVRGAISIAHRLQDPLAEMVKLDPKSIGVGQYQHDVHQPSLKKSLDREVESCVNHVGVNLNMASPSLLSYVAGIGPKLASAIVKYRDENGAFKDRKHLLKVPKLGQKAFQQAAGFLRVPESKNPLDNSAVHPESYYVVEKISQRMGCDLKTLVGDAGLRSKLNPQDYVDDQAGLLTVEDIVQELIKPGRDPREKFQAATFAEGINEITDLHEGLVLEGVVTNVTKFGAFVDIGVHQDGLIHISQLADRFVEDPSDEVSVGDVVKVRVLEVDVARKRISLSRKELV